MPTHCYLIQTHRRPQQILRLVRRLRADSPNALIVVAHDASQCPLDSSLFASIGAHFIEGLSPVVRGEFSMVDAYFHALEAMSGRGLTYDWLTLLSGQDYPIKPLREYEAALAAQAFDGYLQYGDVLGPDSPWARRSQGRLRYFYRYRRLPDSALTWLRVLRRLNGIQKQVHVHTTLGPYLGVRCSSHPFNDSFRCYGGSAWHTLSSACIAYLRHERETNPILVEHFRHTMSPEEAFVQTVLVNSGRFRLHRGNLRFIDFTGSVGGSPRTLTSSDFEQLVKSSCYFARKFDVDMDAAVLDALDASASTVDPMSSQVSEVNREQTQHY